MSAIAADEPILYERLGRVVRLTLNRPQKRNALTADMLKTMAEYLDALEEDESVSVLIIRGAGSCFSAGYDISGLASEEPKGLQANRIAIRKAVAPMQRLWEFALPVIVQAHGHCLAGGTDIAMCSDFLFVADTVQMGYPAVRNLGTPAVQMWLYRLGLQNAKRMLLTGDTLGAEEALRMGLALESHPESQLDEAVLGFANRVAMVTRDCLISNKAVLNAGIELMGRTALQRIALAEDAILHASPGATEFRDSMKAKGLSASAKERDRNFVKRKDI